MTCNIISDNHQVFFFTIKYFSKCIFFLFKYGMLVWVWQKSNEVTKNIKNYNEVQMSDFFSLLEIIMR